MKHILPVLLLLCCCIAANAQKIKRIEYFFDTDPGAGKAKPLAITAADTVSVNTNIPINNLTKGLHTLYLRAKTDTGWGLTENFLFTVYDSALAGRVAREEYFFDNDPGVGKATAIAVSAADTLKVLQNIPTGNLTEGLHTLYIRAGNGAGYYSLTENAMFYVTGFAANAAKISGAEYFIDTDPGAGKAKKINTGAPTDTLNSNYNVNVPAGLDTGINHYLCIRIKDANGVWGLYSFDTFKVKVAAAFATLKLNAVKDGATTSILWNTINSDAVNYTVEKSINGIDFAPLSNVSSKGATQTYKTKDASTVSGVNFYRIKQTNAAGETSYSNIEKVLFDAVNTTGISMYPNPANDLVNIRFNAVGKTVVINIFDATGHCVKMCTAAASEIIQLNVNNLATGNYIVHVSDGEKTVAGKLIKQ